MKYFLHDSNSFNDEKITELFIEFGYEGLGLFYTVLEKLAQQEKPIKTNVLKSQLKVGKKLEKCWLFMESIELVSSNNGETFNKQLMNFSGKYAIKKEKNKKRISEWREKQGVTENVTCYESVRNARKVNKSKVNKSKEDNIEKSEIPILKYNFKQALLDLGIENNIVCEWLLVRKNKKATNSETAFNFLCKQIQMSGLSPNDCIKIAVANSWSGFKYVWLNNKQNGNKTNSRLSTENEQREFIEAIQLGYINASK